MNASRNRRISGFTLLEMLAVVAILGIIAAVVVPRYTRFSDTSKKNIAKHYISQLNALVEKHHADHNAWPADLNELVAAGYLEEVPTHPESSKSYALNSSTNRVEEKLKTDKSLN